MDDFNLDELNFDLNAEIDIEDMFELSTVEDVETINEPHFRLETKEFLNMLRKAKTVITSNARDLISKAVCMEVVDNKLHMYCTDFDVYLEVSHPITNSTNILDGVVVTPIDTLLQLAKALPSTTTILRDENNRVKIRLIGGAMDVETIEIPKDKFIMKDIVKEDKDIDAEVLNTVLNAFGHIIQTSVNPTEKRIVFNENGAKASYMFAIAHVDGDFPKFDIKVKDLGVLKVLVNKAKGKLKTFRVDDEKASLRFVIKGDDFKYAFLIGKMPMNRILLDNFNKIDFMQGAYVEYNKLSKLIELSSTLNYTTGKVKMQFPEANTMIIHVPSKNGDNVFTIEATPRGNIKLEEDVEAPAKLFMSILKAFQKNNTLTIFIEEDKIVLNNDTVKALILLDA